MDENESNSLVVAEKQETALTRPEDFNLSEQETLFCELFINGGALYTGNAEKCFREAFGESDKYAIVHAQQLLKRNDIQQYLEVIDEPIVNEDKFIKKFIATNLMHIIEETSTAEYRDRKGAPQSVAGLRAVAVNASKTLADIYSLRRLPSDRVPKESDEEENNSTKIQGVTFNVVVPVATVPQDQPTIVIGQ